MHDDDIAVGDSLGTNLLPENYIGPEGTVAVITDSTFPDDLVMFVKNRIVIAIYDPNTDNINDIPSEGEYDAIFVQDIGVAPEVLDAARAAARKRFS